MNFIKRLFRRSKSSQTRQSSSEPESPDAKVHRMIGNLKSEDLNMCDTAIEGLAQAGSKEAIQPLLRFLIASKNEITVGRKLLPDASYMEIKMLYDPQGRDVESRKKATLALVAILGPENAARAIWEFFDREVTAKGVYYERLWEILGTLEHNALPILMEIFERKDKPHKIRCLALLAKLKNASLIPIFERALIGEDAELSEAASDALAELGQPAVDTLLRHLQSPVWGLRNRVVIALKTIGGEKAINALRERRAVEQDYSILQKLPV
jgi:hypothetical protein